MHIIAFIASNVVSAAAALDAVLILTLIVHCSLALGVWGDAHALLLEKRYLYLLSPLVWGLTTLLTGLLGATAYWLINRSTLRRD